MSRYHSIISSYILASMEYRSVPHLLRYYSGIYGGYGVQTRAALKLTKFVSVVKDDITLADAEQNS